MKTLPDDAVEILAAYLHPQPEASRFLISPRNVAPYPERAPASRLKFLLRKMPSLREDTFQSYRRAAARDWRLPDDFEGRPPLLVRRTAFALRNIAHFRRARRRYQGYDMIVAWSGLGFSRAGDQALFYIWTDVATWMPMQTAFGWYLLAEKSEEGWRIAETAMIWMS